MTRNLLSNPRRRGVIGAIIGAALPYAVSVYFIGFSQDWADAQSVKFFLGFSIFFALLGYGIFHGGFQGNGLREPGGEDTNRWTETDRDRDDLLHQNGVHASVRSTWDSQYKSR